MRRFRNDERGFTLVEMMVVVTLLSVVLTVLYQGLDSMQTSALGAQERLGNLDEARVMMATITKDIRTAARLTEGASPFDVADAREMTFYANIGSTLGPSKVRIYIDSQNRLIEEVIAPGGTAPNYTYTSTPKVRAVGRYVVPGTTLFRYQYFNQATQAFTELTNVPLSSADRLLVQSVEITIPIRRSSLQASPATTLINRVRLPNVYYNPATQAGS